MKLHEAESFLEKKLSVTQLVNKFSALL